MVITIKNVDKIVGTEIYGRTLTAAIPTQRYGTDSYVFTFSEFHLREPQQPNRSFDWSAPFSIYLYREPKNGKYELFWMGLHGVTVQYLTYEQIKSFDTIQNSMKRIIELAWEYSKS